MENVQNIITTFVKTNKVSKVKIEALVQEILAAMPKPVAASVGRPRTIRDSYHAEIIKFAEENGGTFCRADLEKRGMKMVAFATKTLESEGKIVRLEKGTKVNQRGRSSVTYSLIQQTTQSH